MTNEKLQYLKKTLRLHQYQKFVQIIHKGQLDKSGKEYWRHPYDVANDFTIGSNEYLVGLLHDSLEDTEMTDDDLRFIGLSEEIIKAVKCITHGKHEQLVDYYTRAKGNTIALKVKLADIRDNSRYERVRLLPKDTQDRLKKKYKKALELLEETKENI